MGQNMNKKRPLVWAPNSTREVILGWMDSFNIDADNEAVDGLVRRIHAAALPFDADPMTLLDCLVEAIFWQADRIDGRKAANLLRHAAEQISDAFADAGLIDGQHCVGTTTPDATGDGQSPDAEPEQRDGKNAEEESTPTPGEAPQPMRRELIYDAAVEVQLANGSSGSVAHPPFFGRVRMAPRDGRPRIVPVDDLCQQSQRALKSARVRRRVEVHARCSYAQGCTQKLPAFLAEDQRVEDAEGNTVCGFADLFYGRCPQHLRNE